MICCPQLVCKVIKNSSSIWLYLGYQKNFHGQTDRQTNLVIEAPPRSWKSVFFSTLSIRGGGYIKAKQAWEAINSGHSSKYDYYLNCELLTQANAILASCYVSIVYLSYWSILCPEYVKMAFWGPTDLYWQHFFL